MLHGPMYTLVLYMLLEVAYLQTPSLAGWTRDEGLLLFFTFHLLYNICILFFIGSLKELLWNGVRRGDVDLVLTKPLNSQFLLSVMKPEIQQVGLVVGLLLLFIRQALTMPLSTSPVDLLSFLLLFMTGIAIVYLSMSTYATSAFFFTKAQQVLEVYDKITDISHYPLPMFPKSFQLFAVTVVPIGLMSYAPVSFLLGRGNNAMLTASLGTVGVLLVINQLAWKHGLRRYSSASS